jgi:hypothetical protein
MSKYRHLLKQEVSQNVAYDLLQIDGCDLGDLTIFSQLYYSLEFAIGQSLSDHDSRFYPNASFSILRFVAKIRMIRELCGASTCFLDVGCGLGNKVWIAHQMGFDAYGLEINAKYAEIAGNLVGRSRIMCEDGTTYGDYGKYDVIYFFNPMPSGALEAAIMKGAKKGAIIYHATDLQGPPEREYVRIAKRVLRLTNDLSERSDVQPMNSRNSMRSIVGARVKSRKLRVHS